MTMPARLSRPTIAGGVAVLGAVAAVVVIRRRWVVVVVRGDSMLPAYADGQRVLARRVHRRVRVGDVAAFARPGGPDTEWLVKRVAEVQPDGSLIVLGDNGGFDSRDFGALSARDVRAVLVRRLAG